MRKTAVFRVFLALPRGSGGPTRQFQPEPSGKCPFGHFPDPPTGLILFKGQKVGKSNGNGGSGRSGQNGSECRLGPPDLAGIRENSGKQRKTEETAVFRQVLTAAFAG